VSGEAQLRQAARKMLGSFLPAKPHEHRYEDEEAIDMNVTVAWAVVDGKRVPIAGYVVRNKKCGCEYGVPVG
jgi:hypothetical protein